MHLIISGTLFSEPHVLLQVRMVDARPGIAFIEYENEMQSGVAMGGLQAFKITPEHAISVSYAKQ